MRAFPSRSSDRPDNRPFRLLNLLVLSLAEGEGSLKKATGARHLSLDARSAFPVFYCGPCPGYQAIGRNASLPILVGLAGTNLQRRSDLDGWLSLRPAKSTRRLMLSLLRYLRSFWSQRFDDLSVNTHSPQMSPLQSPLRRPSDCRLPLVGLTSNLYRLLLTIQASQFPQLGVRFVGQTELGSTLR